MFVNLIRLQLSKAKRCDINVPSRCHAKHYKIPDNDVCDCKIWCKYPPPGSLLYQSTRFSQSSEMLLKSELKCAWTTSAQQ